MLVFLIGYRVYLLRLKLDAEKMMRKLSLEKNELAKKQLITLKEFKAVDRNYIKMISEKVNSVDTMQGLLKLKKEIKSLIYQRDNKLEYVEKIKTFSSDLYPKALAVNSKLTNLDLLHISFLRLNYSVAEVAEIQNVSKSTVRSTRSRLKKKLKIDAGTDLSEYIKSL